MSSGTDGWVWPGSTHDLTRPAGSYLGYSDIGWQRRNGQYGRIAGYRRGAELLFDAMVRSRSISDLDQVVFPYATSWRHHIELQLKEVFPGLRELLGRPYETRGHHDIKQLWQEIMAMLRLLWPTDTADLKHVDRIILQFAAMDPDGQGFRYARDTHGNPTLGGVDQIDLPTFHEALIGVSNFLGAVDSHVDHDLQMKREIETEYRQEMEAECRQELADYYP